MIAADCEKEHDAKPMQKTGDDDEQSMEGVEEELSDNTYKTR